MVYYLITCRSLTFAQKAARTLERSGISATITRPPKELSTRGCAYGLKIQESKLDRSLEALEIADVDCDKVYRMGEDGAASEVEL